MDRQNVGFRMKEKRKDKKLTQADFSKLAGVSTNYYASIEQGKNSPSLELLTRIAEALGVSVLYLLNDRIDDMESRVESEVERLKKLFKNIPKDQLDVAEGLIIQAARLRILLDDNWKDILENGEYEKFSQSESQVPYDRKRPIVENYDNRDKTYQAIIKQLTDLLPQQKVDRKSKLLGR
ncbi:DNA-binding transcriptional regulator, XRE-family HTH domain [Halolactibacillus halophilus]|uniref:DNA-binding transcriptional regulator, XRE-family HTH domain n=2 Tax=Halolactibacillus halophilus TaxID=306540 RepID=A0A1I5T9Y2_9BACI|nr:DNA-binding transcriptional regulator, XRE-family HTH domain [Halolactibacillus halophilus]